MIVSYSAYNCIISKPVGRCQPAFLLEAIHLEDKEYSNVYAIPANYTDSGKLFGGMVDTRNAVEAVLLLAAVGAPELFWIPMSGTIRVVVMTVTLIPLGVVAVMGVDGGSLFQYIGHILRFWSHRRKLHSGG